MNLYLSRCVRHIGTIVLLGCVLLGTGCGQNKVIYASSDPFSQTSSGGAAQAPASSMQPSPVPPAPVFPSYQGSYASGNLPADWIPLYQRLRGDGLDGPDLPRLFASLGTPSQDPMGRKIKELYTRAFTPRPAPVPGAPKPAKPQKPAVYAGVITPANAAKCQAFLAANKPAFDFAEQNYGVPREVAVSLLFVETRLGTYLGKEKAFYTLASMASSRSPQAISGYLSQLPGSEGRLDWITERMQQRSDWAYKELVALLKNLRESGANPLTVPGSIYGAIGMCQFMPTNIGAYGADGNGDGVVDLFTAADAVASLSRYLNAHGWGKAPGRAHQHKVIKTYNKIDIYANTILGLAEAQGYIAQ